MFRDHSARPIKSSGLWRLLGLVLGCVFLVLGVACQSTQEAKRPVTSTATTATAPAANVNTAAPATVDRITISQDIDAAKMDPSSTLTGQRRIIFAQVFDTLIHRGPQGEALPRVAEKWEWASDNKTLKLKIRQGIKFQNGDDLTADDVKFTLDRYMDPKIDESASNYSGIDKVVVNDPFNLDIVLKNVDASFLAARILDDIFIMPKKYYESVKDDFNVKPIGSGPYRMAEWVKDDHMTLQANPNYWGGAVPVKTVVFKPIPEETTRVSALLSGDTDIITAVPSTQTDLIKNSNTAVLKAGPSADLIYLGMKPDIPVLKDVRVRTAVNYAINRQAIINRLLGDYATALGSPLIPGMLGYDPAIPPYPYDPGKAKQLLAEAGYPNGFQVPFEIPIGRVPRARDVAQAISADLAAVGIQADIKEYEYNAYMNKLYGRESQTITGMWLYIVRAPGFDPDQNFSTSFYTKGAWNWGHYSDPKLDDLIIQGVQTLDEKKRIEVYRQAAQMAKESGYWAFLYAPQSLYAVRKADKWTWDPRPDGLINVWEDVKIK